MGYRYVPKDLIRHSDFYELYDAFPADVQRKVQRMVDKLISENPSYRLSLLTGPGYFIMHWLMGDLYTSLAIYLILRQSGESQDDILSKIDRCLTEAGKKMNRKVKRIMKLPCVFSITRFTMPRAMTLANGHGFQVTPVEAGRNGFGFNVTRCPYCSLFTKYDVQEIGPVFCRFDDTVSAEMDNLDFIRSGTLCRGNDKCDFLYLRK